MNSNNDVTYDMPFDLSIGKGTVINSLKLVGTEVQNEYLLKILLKLNQTVADHENKN